MFKPCYRRSIDFKGINAEALRCLPAILHRLLPDGKIEGREYSALNPRRADRHRGSFSVNINTGRWADFACDARGGDPISLIAYLETCSQFEAARKLARMLGIDSGARRNG
jgi:hypothetical protein